MSKPVEATACTQEAANLFPTSHNVLYMRGQIAELRGNMDEAKRWYEEALSINPTHVKTMQRLVTLLLLYLSSHSLGGFTISRAISDLLVWTKKVSERHFASVLPQCCVKILKYYKKNNNIQKALTQLVQYI